MVDLRSGGPDDGRGAPGGNRGAANARRAATGLAAVLPGLPQLVAGRVGSGGGALVAWLGGLAVLVLRRERILATGAYGRDEWIAGAVLLLCLAVPWLWSRRDLRRGHRASAGWPVARAFAADRRAVVGLVVVVGAYVVALLAPFLAPYDPVAQGDLLTERLLAPSWTHPLGTDPLGRDVLSRLLWGARVSLLIAFVAVALSVTLGTLVGAVSGYLGRVADAVVMRGIDVVIAFPRLVLLVTVLAFFPPTLTLLVLVLGLTQWPVTTRIVRGEVLSLREREFVQAARALGFSRRRIVLRHLIPNALAPVVVAATLGIGHTIVLEAGLSFLGLGVSAPTPSWGGMIADGRGVFLGAWWLTTFPGMAIVLTVLAVNLVGEGLRDALDPRVEDIP